MSDLQTSFQGQRLQVKNLPTLPTALEEARRLANDPKTPVAKLAEVIGRDQALSSKVLKLVNSPTYGFPGRIASIQHALILIGFNVIKNLLFAATVFESVSKDMSGLWRHSAGCSVICKELGRLLGREDGDELFISGLLHDIGKVITVVQLPEAYQAIIRLVRKEDISYHEAEMRVLGIAHPHIGNWLLEQWNLPKNLRDAVAYHHHPTAAREHVTIASIVHLADFLVQLFEYGNGGDDHVPWLDPHALKHLKLTKHKLGMVVDSVGEILESENL